MKKGRANAKQQEGKVSISQSNKNKEQLNVKNLEKNNNDVSFIFFTWKLFVLYSLFCSNYYKNVLDFNFAILCFRTQSNFYLNKF